MVKIGVTTTILAVSVFIHHVFRRRRTVSECDPIEEETCRDRDQQQRASAGTQYHASEHVADVQDPSGKGTQAPAIPSTFQSSPHPLSTSPELCNVNDNGVDGHVIVTVGKHQSPKNDSSRTSAKLDRKHDVPVSPKSVVKVAGVRRKALRHRSSGGRKSIRTDRSSGAVPQINGGSAHKCGPSYDDGSENRGRDWLHTGNGRTGQRHRGKNISSSGVKNMRQPKTFSKRHLPKWKITWVLKRHRMDWTLCTMHFLNSVHNALSVIGCFFKVS